MNDVKQNCNLKSVVEWTDTSLHIHSILLLAKFLNERKRSCLCNVVLLPCSLPFCSASSFLSSLMSPCCSTLSFYPRSRAVGQCSSKLVAGCWRALTCPCFLGERSQTTNTVELSCPSCGAKKSGLG